MAKLSTCGKKRHGILKLKIVVEKLQRSILLGRKSYSYHEVEDSNSTSIPEDVKEGHFAVVAMDDEEPERFVVPLRYLTHPTFLRLLEQAAEEYGFDHEGALMVPCSPWELERILAEEQWQEDRSSNWRSCASVLQTY